MKRLIMWNLMTLDGYFEGKEPWDLSFHELVWGDELAELSLRQLDSAEAIVYGAATYKGMASHWGKEEGDIADRMNRIQKYVCSSTLGQADWNNTTIIRDAVVGISELKEKGDGNLFVFGSAILSGSLMASGLFDEYRLCIAPVYLGKGRRLFETGLPYERLSVLEARKLSTGGVLLRYGKTN